MAECSRKCSSRLHGSQLTSAITRRAPTDEALAAYLRACCGNFTQALDELGRTALHMACSRGRRRLAEWLARHSSDAFANVRDRESGYTPLHRSVFYGQVHVAVVLLKLGVNDDLTDKDDYRALDHVLLDRRYMHRAPSSEPRLAYVWGSNSNDTLGTETQRQRRSPDELVCFARSDVSIEQVVLGKFHSVWVTSDGALYACGQASRFGAPSCGTVLRPRRLLLSESEPIRQAALTLDSTVILLGNGAVLQYKLSIASDASSKDQKVIKLKQVKPLIKLQEPLGLVASRHHSMLWNRRAIHTWGANYGQLGHSPGEKSVDTPTRVAVNTKEETNIELGGVSEAASVFSTSRGDVYLLHEHICKKIAVKQINLRQLAVECRAEGNAGSARVTVLMLTSLGQVLLWHNTCSQLTRCTYGLSHQLVVTHLCLTHDHVYLTTKLGQAYQGVIMRRTAPPSASHVVKTRERDGNRPLVKLLEKEDCTAVKLRRIPNVHRAVALAVDAEDMNYACLQTNPHSRMKFAPIVSPTDYPQQLDILRKDAHADDLMHDVIFKVGNRQYPAHMFVVASGCELLYKMYQHTKTIQEKPVIAVENIHHEVFERILQYLYTGACDVTEAGPCGLKIKREDLVEEKKKPEEKEEAGGTGAATVISAYEAYKKDPKRGGRKKMADAEKQPTRSPYWDPVKLVQNAAKRLQITTLHKMLDKVYHRDGHIYKAHGNTEEPTPPWRRDSFPELVDTTVRCKDGFAIPAHKCVLAARLQYFNSMFMHSWTESEKQSLVTLPISHAILLPIVNFLYTDTCPELANSESVEFICNLLVIADQLFVTRLREMCEKSLSSMVTVKNCAELCQFAHTYNADQLKRYCMEFISLNLATFLENKSLNILEDVLLEDITSYYCKINTIMSSRIITPFCNAPDEKVINDCAKAHPIDLQQVDEELKKTEVKKKKKAPRKAEYTESEKARMRHESNSSVTSLDISIDMPGDITLALQKITPEAEKGEKQEKWVKVTGQQKQQKIVQARLKAISSAKDIQDEKPQESFTRLSNPWIRSPPAQPQPIAIPTTSRMSVSPSDYESPWRSPQSPVYISHVGVKLSQKQRKKLALQGNDPTSQNLEKLTITDSPPAKKSPWKIMEASPAGRVAVKPVQFDQILADQQKQKENSSRVMTKSLAMTQLEDKAMEELSRFYNADQADEEWITVRRIEVQVSSPQWLHTAPK